MKKSAFTTSTEMLLERLPDAATRTEVLAYAEQLAGRDQSHFSQEWVSRTDIFVVPEENEDHAGEYKADKLARACSAIPGTHWYSAAVFEGKAREPLKVVDPARALSWGDNGQEPLGALYLGQTFLLFCLEGEAAILYSEYEVALVSGVRQFVEGYFGDPRAAVREFEEFMEEEQQLRAADEQFVMMLRRRAKTFREQIRLP